MRNINTTEQREVFTNLIDARPEFSEIIGKIQSSLLLGYQI